MEFCIWEKDKKVIMIFQFYFRLANRGPVLPGTIFLTQQYKDTHPNILCYTNFVLA